jgi:hypothetical protein
VEQKGKVKSGISSHLIVANMAAQPLLAFNSPINSSIFKRSIGEILAESLTQYNEAHKYINSIANNSSTNISNSTTTSNKKRKSNVLSSAALLPTKYRKSYASYCEELNKQSQSLVENKIPAWIIELHGLEKTFPPFATDPKLNSLYSTMQKTQPPPTAQPIPEFNHDSLDKTSAASYVYAAHTTPTYLLAIPTNTALNSLQLAVKEHVINFLTAMQTLRTNLQLNLPVIDESKPVAASVISEIIEICNRNEQLAWQDYDRNTYFLAQRAKIAGKIAKYPGISDYMNAIYLADEQRALALKTACREMRNYYISMLDLMKKHEETIFTSATHHYSSMY